jgi:hypothetical protein
MLAQSWLGVSGWDCWWDSFGGLMGWELDEWLEGTGDGRWERVMGC